MVALLPPRERIVWEISRIVPANPRTSSVAWVLLIPYQPASLECHKGIYFYIYIMQLPSVRLRR